MKEIIIIFPRILTCYSHHKPFTRLLEIQGGGNDGIKNEVFAYFVKSCEDVKQELYRFVYD